MLNVRFTSIKHKQLHSREIELLEGVNVKRQVYANNTCTPHSCTTKPHVRIMEVSVRVIRP